MWVQIERQEEQKRAEAFVLGGYKSWGSEGNSEAPLQPKYSWLHLDSKNINSAELPALARVIASNEDSSEEQSTLELYLGRPLLRKTATE